MVTTDSRSLLRVRISISMFLYGNNGYYMIKLLHKIPRKVTLAFSGGVDSVAVADFLRRNHDISLLYVDHKTDTSKKAISFVHKQASKWNLPLYVFSIDSDKPNRLSQEEHWRNERYRIFHSVTGPVITCHHLDDCVENWIWSSLNGCSKTIPYRNRNVIRPFLITRKHEFIRWCNRKQLSWSEDLSNADTKYTRNYIRHELMPHALRVNPGIHKTVMNKVLECQNNM